MGQRHERLLLGLILQAVALLPSGGGCGGSSPPAANRPVLLDPEDVADDDMTCHVVQRAILDASAELASPALARSDRGVLVAWVRRASGPRQIGLLEISPELTPRGEVAELDPGGDMPLDLSLAACGSRYHVTWQLQEREGQSIRTATALPGASQPAPVDPIVVAGLGMAPTMGCLGDTTAVAWSVRRDGIQDIMLRWLGPSGDLSEPIRVSGETDAAAAPAMACAAGHCALAWSDRRDVYAEIYATLIDEGADHAARPVAVSHHDQTLSGAGGGYGPDIGAIGDRGFVVAWHDNRSEDESEIYAATLSARGNAGANRRITMSTASSTAPSVAGCSDGQTTIAWRDRRDGPAKVMIAAVDDHARRRSAATMITADVEEASSPASICVEGAGHVVAWTEADRASGDNALAVAVVRCE